MGAVTTDGSCGSQHGNTICGNWPSGSCCSVNGFCGNTTAYCGTGCQSGPCSPSGSSTPLASPTVVAVTTNGSCGSQNGGTICGNWPSGACCSVNGYCGNTTAYCGAGCQSGPCNPSGSSSSTATPTTGAVTIDGSCGSQHGGTVCGNWPSGACCSINGFCGNTTAYCGSGCQSGPCVGTSTPSASPTPGAVTTNGSCGSQNGGTVCGNWPSGSCCSPAGFCGNTTAYCGTGCQSGPCGTGTSTTSATPSPEPTITHNPACPADNNTQFTDIFSTTYDIRCGLSIVGTQGYSAHADNFPKCLEFCDILGGCAGVTYVDPVTNTDANCLPYTAFTGYGTAANINTYSGVSINGPTSKSASSMALCPVDNGANYTDTFGVQYGIGCDQSLPGTGPQGAGGPSLVNTNAPNLDGCLLYCSIYTGCVAVDFTTAQVSINCQPLFNVTGPAIAATGSQYAQAN